MKSRKEIKETAGFLFGMAVMLFLCVVSYIVYENDTLINHDGKVCECECF